MNKEEIPYDLEERTYLFAKRCKDFVNKLPKTSANTEYGKQLIKSSGSQAANYIEAGEALGKKDKSYRIRIARKETKESCLWLRLCETGDNDELEKERKDLIDEGNQLRSIFSTILEKIEN